MVARFVLFLYFIFLHLIVLSDEKSERAITAMRVSEGDISIDGYLNEPVWEKGEPGSGFIQREPVNGTPATERTEFRVLYSDVAIYVGVRAYDSNPDGIRAQLARRDRLSQSDEIAIFFDSYYDRRTAFEFAVNPRGSIRDSYRFNDSPWQQDLSWDPVWEVATSIDSLGWTAEFRIPLTQLRFDENNTTWGFQVYRRIERKAEEVYWSPFPQGYNRFVSLFGKLQGLGGLSQPLRLEIRPYTVIDSRFRPPQDGLMYAPEQQVGLNAGVDLQYGLTSDFMLDVTINPDFGQVEADPADINLTAFETFFPERRPFFVEGSGFFNQWMVIGQPFYSRRIGRSPQGAVSPPPGGTIERPDRTTILGAAKLTGKSAAGLGLGLLSAVTGSERANLRNENGVIIDEPVIEPLTHYFAGRVERDFKEGEHNVGVFLTSVNRNLKENLEFLHSSSFTYLANGSHRLWDKSYIAQWQVYGSHVRGSEETLLRTQRSPFHYFQRADAGHLHVDPERTSLSGYGFELSAGRDAGSWQYRLAYALTDPGMNISDIGFQWRGTDRQQFNVFLNYVQTNPRWIFRNFSMGPALTRTGTTGGELLSTWFRPIFFSATLKNNWSFGFNPGAVRWENRLVTALRGGPSLRGDLWRQHFITVNSDRRKPVSFNLFTYIGSIDPTPRRWYGIDNTFRMRAGESFDFSLTFRYYHERNPIQWVTHRIALEKDRYILAEIEQHTLSFQTRVNWILSPTLSIELFAEPFVSAGLYSHFKEVINPMASRFNDRFRFFGEELFCRDDGICEVNLTGDGVPDITFGNPDFNFVQLRSTFVLRWEYRPGSVLFFAWQHGRNAFTPYGNFGGLRDMGDLFRIPTDNIFLVKANYRFSF